ncbi:ATP-binding protein [Escherichia fergusonii]|uniref:ATP-binding protein n=1 Tax=Escherichia fergusonii TaxID=564 RepID=UPI0015E57636|nr:ATP-binding protein [Escherichia fergusonii]QLM89170.1 ATP-binding protein [Escherichia fergusonii]QMH66537.1 ATP-binding protein [Escherichia fergusonii]QML45775.1 ATP-binding protein [Escherichia fergusonii]QMS05677.1 ATP-binding protein [Escherichia fergusonii]
MKATEVFIPGGYPNHTLVEDHLVSKQQQLIDTLEMGTMLISISGPSKSGKTVFVKKVLGTQRIIEVTGAGVQSANDLWKRVFDILGVPVTQVQSKTGTSSFSGTGELSAQAGVILAKGSLKGSASAGYSTADQTSESFAIDLFQLMKREIANTDYVIFIDDFHYIAKEAQAELSRQIKDAIANGCKFICASVPYHSDDVLRGNSDLRGRIFNIDFDYWDESTLKIIAQKGFKLLNIDASDEVISELVKESAGSPQLMQYLCLNSCFEMNVRETSDTSIKYQKDIATLQRVCKRTLQSADYSTIVDKMREGPKVRGSDRKSYISKDGWQGDVYVFLLKAIASNPPTLTFRYSDLVSRVTSLCHGDSPSGSSITSACQHSTAIANDAANSSIIEWDQESDVLDIRDPYLLFYLRWI